MTQTMRKTTALIIAATILMATHAKCTSVASAQIFNGPGLEAGIDIADSVSGLPNSNDPRRVVIDVINTILEYLALLAVIMIIIAGIYLVISLGEDEQKDKAKRIITYTLIGLVVILLARIIVGLITVVLYNALP